MNKLWKKFTVLFAVLTLALTCGIFAACGGNDDFSAKVTLPDGTPVAGVWVKFCILDENGNEKTCVNAQTDEKGVATPNPELMDKSANYHVAIVSGMPGTPADFVNGLPNGYKAETNDGWFTDDVGHSFTIKLVAAD